MTVGNELQGTAAASGSVAKRQRYQNLGKKQAVAGRTAARDGDFRFCQQASGDIHIRPCCPQT